MIARRPVLLALALLAATLAADPTSGQEVSGMALSPEGTPLPGVPVALHRVGGMGGASVASAVTDDGGRFRFALEDADSAVYFAAMRYDGRMFIGPAIRSGGAPITDYELRADPAAEAGAVASALSGQGPVRPRAQAPSDSNGDLAAIAIVTLLAMAAAAVFITTAPAYRRRRTRDMLVELATIESRLAESRPGDARESLLARKDRLRERLAPGD